MIENRPSKTTWRNVYPAAGEPFQSFFDPSWLKDKIIGMGFRQIEDLDPEGLMVRFFQGRTDGLRVGSLGNVVMARV